MKYAFIILLSIGFFFSLSAAGDKVKLKDQRDKDSYSLGYQFGESLKRGGVDIKLTAYTYGIQDALGGKEPLMRIEEIRATVRGLRQRTIVAQKEKHKELAAKNLFEGKTFMQKNAKIKGVKTLPSGLQYRVLVKGSGRNPKANDTVTVHYSGTFINGTEFDSSYKRGRPQTFQVNGVIRGWTEALQLMKEGAKWQLFIPPKLAYGERGRGSRMPPNSTLIFEVELISIK